MYLGIYNRTNPFSPPSDIELRINVYNLFIEL